MSLSTVQIWQSIQEGEIASAADCRQWAAEILTSVGNAALDNPQMMLAQLVKLGHLTPFQANALLSNDTQTLVIGRHRLLAQLSSPALSDWFEAIDPSSNAARWLYAISKDRLKEPAFDRHPPSLKLAREHASVRATGLQNFSPPAFIDGYLLIAATPADGQPLREMLKAFPRRSLPVDAAFKIVNRIARSLAELHSKGIVHGRIGIDQIWWDGKEEVTLLRDPFFPPVTPLGPDMPTAVGVDDDQDYRVRYAAPEFTAPGQPPTQATDVYALGCLWWELMMGQLPYAEMMMDKVPTAASKFPLTIPQDLAISPSQRRCLDHMLAKNPSMRFIDANQLVAAFEVICPSSSSVIDPPPVPTKDPTPVAASLREASSKITEAPKPPAPIIASSAIETSAIASSTIAAPAQRPSKPIESPKPAQVKLEPTTQATDVAAPKSIQTPILPSPTQPPPTRQTSRPAETPKPVSAKTEPKELAAGVVAASVAATNVAVPSAVPSTKPSPKPESGASSSTPNALAPVTPKPQSPAILEIPSVAKTADVTSSDSKVVIASIQEVKPLSGKTTSSTALNTLATNAPVRPSVRKTKKKTSRPVWLFPAMIGFCVLLLSGLVGILTWNNDSSTPKAPPVVSQAPTAVNDSGTPVTGTETANTSTGSTKPRVVDPIEDQFSVSKGDDSLPWVPPRASQPYSLSMLPPGAQGFIFIRPQAWQTTQAGKAILESLATSIDTIWKPIEKTSAIASESIEELAVGLYPGRPDGWPVMAFRVQLKEDVSRAALKQKLATASEQTINDKAAILVNGDQAIFLGPSTFDANAKSSTITIGPVSLIRELVDLDGGGAPLRRQMEQLWQASDAHSDLSLLLTTGFFFSDARSVLPSISPRVLSLGKELLDEKTQALLITTSLEPNWYGEMRVVGQTGDDATRFTKDVRERMKSIADTMESELVASPASPYWRALAGRFPQMLRSFGRYQRFGIENGQAIWNFYLPAAAAANMTIATWMAVQTPVAAVASPTTVAATETAKKLTGDDLLAYPISINFEQEPLDSALALLTDEINRSLPAGTGPMTLSIDGKAFELSSVTRNQQIRDFRFKEQPLRDLLTDLVKRVNPDRTVQSLDEVKQAVVWILTESDGKPSILFTTRRGLEGSDKKLPKEFNAPAS